MHVQYLESVDLIRRWSRQDENIQGAVLLGSQVRSFASGDEWSDLDVLLFARDTALLMKQTQWMQQFGNVVLTSKETVDLSFAGLTWHVWRVIYDDHRMIDFSVIPFHKMEIALEINKEIHANGFQVIYDAAGHAIQTMIEASISTIKKEQATIPPKDELDNLIGDLLFHLIFAGRKLMRNELWTAVRCINQPLNDMVIRLIEYYNGFVSGKDFPITYEGRLLELRTDDEILRRLLKCFCKYQQDDAWDTLQHLVEFVKSISVRLYAALHYMLDESPFDMVRTMVIAMKGQKAGIGSSTFQNGRDY